MHDATITMSAITPQAEKQYARLSPLNQERVRRAVTEPVPAKGCTAVKNLKQHRVFHFRVSDTLRVSFTRVGKRHCVIDVGVHSHFDRFATHYQGIGSSNITPLKESTIMRNKNNNGRSNESQKTQEAQRVSRLNGDSTGSNSSHHDMARFMVEMVAQMCADTIRAEVSEKISSLDSVVGGHVDRIDDLAREARRLNAKDEERHKQLDGVGDSLEEWAAKVQRLLTEEARCRAKQNRRLNVGIQAIEARQDRESQDTADSFSQVTARLDGIAGRLDEQDARGEDAVATASQLAERIESLSAAVTQLSNQNDLLQAVTHALSEELGSTKERFAVVETQLAELQRTQQELEIANSRTLYAWLKRAVKRLYRSH